MSVNYLLGSLSTLTMLVCPGFPVLHAVELLLPSQAVRLVVSGLRALALALALALAPRLQSTLSSAYRAPSVGS